MGGMVPAAPQETAFETGRRLVARHGSAERRPAEFELLEMDWHLLPGVFAPVHTDSTGLFSTWVPFPAGGTFLEVGCGAGVTSVRAALAGAEVTAVDIAPAAVRNTELNAARHRVGHRVRAVTSDLFDALDARLRFDVIFWNSNVVKAPDDYRFTSHLEHAILDAGYRTHARYLREGMARLTPGGRLLLGYNSLGDRGALERLLTEYGLRAVPLRSARRRTGPVATTFELLAITEASGAGAGVEY